MRLFDLFEQYPSQNIRDDVEATLPPVLEVPELDNSNSYRQYRFQSYMAAARAVEAGDVPFSAVTPWEQYLAVVGYTDAEIETAKLAARQAGIQIKMLNTTKSHEPDWVNKVSPVANIPMTESRRKLREEENVPRVTEMPDITQPKEIDPKTDIAQVQRRVVVIYPGRFQPLHQAHQQVYRNLQDRFPDADVYIATSDKTDPDKSPFTFNDKVAMARAAGIPTDKIVQVKSPYAPQEITKRYDPQGTVLLIAVGAKDMAEDPRFKFGKKKDGSPTYLQQFDDMDHAKGMDQHGYVIEAPTINFDLLGHPATSATQIRKAYRAADGETRDRIIAQLYDDPSVELRQLFDARLGNQLSESSDARNTGLTLRYMAQFLDLCKNELGLAKLPRIIWTSDSTAHGNRPTFGKYVNDDKTITISIVNRHPVDIMRTLAHELTHYKQDLTQGLDAHSGDTGSAEENQANAMAGIIMRKFDELHPSAFETQPIMEWTTQTKLLRTLINRKFGNVPHEAHEYHDTVIGVSKVPVETGPLMGNYLAIATDGNGMIIKADKSSDIALQNGMMSMGISPGPYIYEDQPTYLQAPLDPEGDTDGPGETGDAFEEHIEKVKGGYRLLSKKTGKNLGTYPTRAGAEKRERQVQYFKHRNDEGLTQQDISVDPAAAMDRAELEQLLHDMKGTLHPRTERMLDQWAQGVTLAQIAADHGLSDSRVKVIIDKALNVLRAKMDLHTQTDTGYLYGLKNRPERRSNWAAISMYPHAFADVIAKNPKAKVVRVDLPGTPGYTVVPKSDPRPEVDPNVSKTRQYNLLQQKMILLRNKLKDLENKAVAKGTWDKLRLDPVYAHYEKQARKLRDEMQALSGQSKGLTPKKTYTYQKASGAKTRYD